MLRTVSPRWVRRTDSVSTHLKPSRVTSGAKASGIDSAFMPKAGSRSASPGTPGTLPSPVMTSTSPSLASPPATTVPWILI